MADRSKVTQARKAKLKMRFRGEARLRAEVVKTEEKLALLREILTEATQ